MAKLDGGSKRQDSVGPEGIARLVDDLNRQSVHHTFSMVRQTNADGSTEHTVAKQRKRTASKPAYTPEEIRDNERWLNGIGETQTKLREAGLKIGALVADQNGNVRYAK